MKTALVTGATGAAGPAVVRALAAAGYRVRTFSRQAPSTAEFNCEPVSGDIRNLDAVRAAATGVNLIVHMAAVLHETRPDAQTLAAYREVNVRGTENVARATVDCGVDRLVHVSTIAVYGSGHASPRTEASPPAPDSPYAASKLASEQAAFSAVGPGGLPLTVVLRPAAIYGPGLKGNYLRLVRALSRGRFIQIGAARNCRALIFDEDFGRAVVAAAGATAAAGQVFNVSDGQHYALHEIIGAIAAAVDRRPPRWHVPAPLALLGGTAIDSASAMAGRTTTFGTDLKKYLENLLIDASKIQRDCGYAPARSLADGWRLTVDGLRQAQRLG